MRLQSLGFKFYKIFVKGFFKALLLPLHNCRFVPSCSEYFEDAVSKYGPVKGGFGGIKRLLSCTPGKEWILDPVR